jgi:hypothetical protein
VGKSACPHAHVKKKKPIGAGTRGLGKLKKIKSPGIAHQRRASPELLNVTAVVRKASHEGNVRSGVSTFVADPE